MFKASSKILPTIIVLNKKIVLNILVFILHEYAIIYSV